MTCVFQPSFFVTAAPAALLSLGAFPTTAWADPTPECNIPDPLAPTSTECGVNSSVFDVGALRVAVDATAVGGDSEAFGDASTAIGYSASARDTNATAIGANSTAAQATSTAIGANAEAFDNSVALGYGSTTLSGGTGAPIPRANTVSVGSAVNGTAGIFQRQITNVAAGTEAFDAVNKGQLDAAIASVAGGGVITTGNGVDSLQKRGEHRKRRRCRRIGQRPGGIGRRCGRYRRSQLRNRNWRGSDRRR